MAAGNHYPYCFMPEDVWAVLGKDRENMMFIDVQARGYYPNYDKKLFEKKKIKLDLTEEDEKILELQKEVDKARRERKLAEPQEDLDVEDLGDMKTVGAAVEAEDTQFDE